ncbi:MAG: von Willebrand factor type A domain-containing protein, partial [Bacteroidales bacterium]|nr:von Willebrand factor type A domain-containing protein [Bacteroidales bacterium]
MKKIAIIIAAAAAATVISCSKGDYYGGFYDYESVSPMYDQEVEDPSGNQFDEIKENKFIKAADEPTSTFSVDADGAAYAYMRRCLNSGRLPEPNSVRIEEYLNYFTFDYADPTGNETVAINAEIGVCPWNPEH